MFRSISFLLIATFLSSNLRAACSSQLVLLESKATAPLDQAHIGDTLSISEFSRFTRKGFEEKIGKKLSPSERREFRQLKRVAKQHLILNTMKKSFRRLLWGLSFVVAGTAALTVWIATNVGCEDDGCSKKWADIVGIAGAAIGFTGFIVLLNADNDTKKKNEHKN